MLDGPDDISGLEQVTSRRLLAEHTARRRLDLDLCLRGRDLGDDIARFDLGAVVDSPRDELDVLIAGEVAGDLDGDGRHAGGCFGHTMSMLWFWLTVNG